MADEFAVDHCDIRQPSPEFESALGQQTNARPVSLEENAEQHMLPQARRLFDRVLDERGTNAESTDRRSDVVGDFGGPSQRGASRPIRAQRAPPDHRAFTLCDVDRQAGRVMLVESGGSLVDGHRL